MEEVNWKEGVGFAELPVLASPLNSPWAPVREEAERVETSAPGESTRPQPPPSLSRHPGSGERRDTLGKVRKGEEIHVCDTL